MSNIIDIFREDIRIKYQINYPEPSNLDRVLVEEIEYQYLSMKKNNYVISKYE